MQKPLKDAITICKTILRNGYDAHIFNSALIYELSVLKLYAEPLLFQIEEGEPEYQEAKRLLKFLDYFVGVPIEDIPKNSILREFVSRSTFSGQGVWFGYFSRSGAAAPSIM